MKTKAWITIGLLAATFTGKAQSYPFDHPDSMPSRAIYLRDNRKDAQTVYGYSTYARATAVAMSVNDVYGNRVNGPTLRQYLSQRFGTDKFGDNVRFLDQPAVGNCTGFLIAPDILVTAGHCFEDASDMKNWVWVFDYTSDVPYNNSSGYVTVKESNIYRGVEMLDRKLESYPAPLDYCVIRLDRAADRTPYRFRTSGKVATLSSIAMIGSPTGLPLKLADSARVVRNTEKTYFESDLDGMPGNSGGPVFGSDGLIEGIHVRGIAGGDYQYDEYCDCVYSPVYDIKTSLGSSANRITSIPWWIQKLAIYNSISYFLKTKDEYNLYLWLGYNFILKDGPSGKKSLLIVAAENYSPKTIGQMLDLEGDFNVKDDYGKPLLFYMIEQADETNIKKFAGLKGVNGNIQNSSGYTAVHQAISTRTSLSYIEPLLKAGLNVNTADNYGNTPLHMAVTMNDEASVRWLIDNYAYLNATDNAGLTPYKLAKKLKHKSIKKLLKKASK